MGAEGGIIDRVARKSSVFKGLPTKEKPAEAFQKHVLFPTVSKALLGSLRIPK